MACDDDHLTLSMRSWVEPSLYTPIAVNCCVPPTGSVGVNGKTSIATSVVRGPTVSGAEAVTFCSVAVISAEPDPTALTSPGEADPFDTLATVACDDDHLTLSVMSWVELSLYTPTATNWQVSPGDNAEQD